METQPEKHSEIFSIKSPFSQEIYTKCESLFKSKWKQLSIQQGEKLLLKLHPEVLEEDFPETLGMFDSNNHLVSLPEDLNTQNIEFLVKFLYLREISPPISIVQTFELLNLAVFFKVHNLIQEIQDFLVLNLNSIDSEPQQILKNSLNAFLIFQNNCSGRNIESILQSPLAFDDHSPEKPKIRRNYESFQQ